MVAWVEPLPHPEIIFNNFSSPIQLQIKQKYWPASSPTGQPKILNQTKFFSSKLKALPAQPNPKSKIPNPNQTKQTLPSSPHASA